MHFVQVGPYLEDSKELTMIIENMAMEQSDEIIFKIYGNYYY